MTVIADQLLVQNGTSDSPSWQAPSDWIGGREVEVIYDPTNTSAKKPIMWLERKATGEGSSEYPIGISFVGEVTGPGTKAISGIKSAMTNSGAGNDAVGLSARTANESEGGMSCGTFGAVAVENENAGASMGLEGHVYVRAGTTSPRDGSGSQWRTALHLFSSGMAAPAHFAVNIDSKGWETGHNGFWNGITIDGTAFCHNGSGSGISGTVGINCADWGTDGYYPETGLKMGKVGGYHIDRGNADFMVRSQDFVNENTSGFAQFISRPMDASTLGGFRVEVDDGDGGYTSAAKFTWDGGAAIVGTELEKPVIFKTNDIERLRITKDGDLQSDYWSGSVADGSVFESDGELSIDTGQYIKNADGTMECWVRNISSAASAAKTWTFPEAFIENPVCTVTPRYSGGMRLANVTSISTTSVSFRTSDMTGDESKSPNVDIVVHGRWK